MCQGSTVLAMLIIVALPGVAQAQHRLTLDEAIEAALGENPGLDAATSSADAAAARPPQAATPPDPNFMVQFGQVPINTTDVNQGTTTYMVQQEIPFPSKLVYGYKAEKRAAEAARSEEAMSAQEIRRRVTLTFVELWRLEEEERIERRTLVAYRQSKGAAEQAYASLDANVADPVRAAVDLGDVEARLALIEQERLIALANLGALMNRPLDPAVRVAAPASPPAVAPEGALLEKASAARPELAATGQLVASQRARVGLAKSQYAPDLTLRWGYDDRPNNQQDAWTGRVIVSVPLWALSKQRFEVRESQALLKRARSIDEEMALKTAAEIKGAYARLAASKKRLHIYQGQVVPRARQLVASSREAYRSGKGDFLGLVDSIRSLSNAEVMRARSRAAAHSAWADLERAVGASPAKEDL